jgi:pyrimidine operon attenuation protein / uracil phosphoribosyltransferase
VPTSASPAHASVQPNGHGHTILAHREIQRALSRLAVEIVEAATKLNGATNPTEKLVLIGIRRGGVHLAHRLAKLIEQHEGHAPRTGVVDISLYRDDFAQSLPRPEIGPTELDFPLTGLTVVLVDDVFFTGRTIRAALDALMDFGRPKAIRLAVLVNRAGHRELPVTPDFVGLTVDGPATEHVEVYFKEAGHAHDSVQRFAARPATDEDLRVIPASPKAPAKPKATEKRVTRVGVPPGTAKQPAGGSERQDPRTAKKAPAKKGAAKK